MNRLDVVIALFANWISAIGTVMLCGFEIFGRLAIWLAPDSFHDADSLRLQLAIGLSMLWSCFVVWALSTIILQINSVGATMLRQFLQSNQTASAIERGIEEINRTKAQKNNTARISPSNPHGQGYQLPPSGSLKRS